MRAMRKSEKPAIVSEEQQKTMLKIGDVSKRSGLGIETLRFYEKSGLLDKPGRTHSGYRMYSPEILERINFIRQAQALGFTLDEIRRIIEDAKGKSPCDDVRKIVRQRLAEADQRIEELTRYRETIATILEDWDAKGHAPGFICGLIESAHLEQAAKPKKRLRQP